uniref:Coilin N-terminal domain-containing protein n=1 Tax=Salarias fasciatus TaxID=181472 RepID=A0A672FJN5_SALFA
MADGASSLIRLRLSFDYPPPAAAGCRLCWLLLDRNRCRVVADLESLIRDKFQFSRGSILSLFIQDCYLPHTESVYVVRDNDSSCVCFCRTSLFIVNSDLRSAVTGVSKLKGCEKL